MLNNFLVYVNLVVTLLLGRHLNDDQILKKITHIAKIVVNTLTLRERCTPKVKQAIDRVIEKILSHLHL